MPFVQTIATGKFQDTCTCTTKGLVKSIVMIIEDETSDIFRPILIVETSTDEAVPHKKRKQFRITGEKDVGSNSDGETSDSSHKGNFIVVHEEPYVETVRYI